MNPHDKNACVLVDIDGTLADLQHRRHFVDKPDYKDRDWDKFFQPDLVKKDKLIQPVATIVTTLQTTWPIIYVSGRRDDLRATTEVWLRKHHLWFFPHKLYMRAAGDTRADTIVKRELLAEIKEEGWKPFLSLDDRASVVSMWREEGITCFQVCEGDF